MTDTLGVAVIGCGYWGINYVRVFSELPQARVTAICDQRTDRLQEVGRRFPNIRLVTDVNQVLDLDGVDAVVISTPAATHYDLARQCLCADKHILLEKPITRTAPEAEELTQMADAKRLTLMVGHTFLYHPGIRKVKDYLQDGKIGQIYYLYARRTNMGPIRKDVSALWDLAPHDVSIFHYLLDSTPRWVSAVGAKILRNCREDVGFVTLGFDSGVIAHIHVSWADSYKVREVVVVGSDMRIVFNDFNAEQRVRVFERGVSIVEPEATSYGEFQLRMRDGDIISPKVAISEPLKNECSHFTECVTQGTRPLTDGWAGRDVVRVMEAIDRSIEHKGAQVEIE